MLAISPQFCSSGWLLDNMEDNPISQEQLNMNYLSGGGRTETSSDYSTYLHSPNFSSKTEPNKKGFSDGLIRQLGDHDNNNNNNNMAKKLNHNASERDRSKRVNTSYSSLRSLLPAEDESRKLSIPATVTRALKYIPELQKEVERLGQNKESLMSKISRVEDYCSSSSHGINFKNKRRKSIQGSFPTVSLTQISEREIVIQSSIPKAEKGSFSEAVLNLEQVGFLVMNASCFESFGGRVCYNLHLQAQGNQAMDVEMLKEILCPILWEKGEILLT